MHLSTLPEAEHISQVRHLSIIFWHKFNLADWTIFPDLTKQYPLACSLRLRIKSALAQSLLKFIMK